MVDLRQQSAVPTLETGKGTKTQSREVADSPRSAGEVDGASNFDFPTKAGKLTLSCFFFSPSS